jgi:hypothetical protein
LTRRERRFLSAVRRLHEGVRERERERERRKRKRKRSATTHRSKWTGIRESEWTGAHYATAAVADADAMLKRVRGSCGTGKRR